MKTQPTVYRASAYDAGNLDPARRDVVEKIAQLRLLAIAVVVCVAGCFGGAAQMNTILGRSCRLFGGRLGRRRLSLLGVTR